MRVVAGGALQAAASLHVTAAQDEAPCGITDADGVTDDFADRFRVEISGRLPVTGSAKLVLFAIRHPSGMANGQTLCRGSPRHHFDVLFAWAVTALALNADAGMRDVFRKDLRFTGNMTAETCLALALFKPIGERIGRISNLRFGTGRDVEFT